MATTNFQTGLFQFVVNEIAGCPEPLLNQVIRDVVQDFCRDTQCWEELLKPIDTKKDVTRYSVRPSGTDREIHKIMNVLTGQNDEPVHDGTDTLAWTASAGQGTWDFASSTRSYAGGLSIDATATVDTDYAELTRGRDFSTNDYRHLQGVIYNSSWSAGTDDIAVQFYLDGSSVGNSVNISDYIDEEVLDEWQIFTIPMSDFGSIPNVDVIRLTVSNSPDSFLDSVRILLDAVARPRTLSARSDYAVDGFQTVVLTNRPSEDRDNDLWVKVCNVPSAASTSLESEIYDRYKDVLARGVKWKLYSMANSSWGNVDLSIYHEAYYLAGKNRIRTDYKNKRTNFRPIVSVRGGR